MRVRVPGFQAGSRLNHRHREERKERGQGLPLFPFSFSSPLSSRVSSLRGGGSPCVPVYLGRVKVSLVEALEETEEELGRRQQQRRRRRELLASSSSTSSSMENEWAKFDAAANALMEEG